MTPKQKAEELYNKFSKHAYLWDCYNDSPIEDVDHTKECVLICINECMRKESVVDSWVKRNKVVIFWEKVKQELELFLIKQQ